MSYIVTVFILICKFCTLNMNSGHKIAFKFLCLEIQVNVMVTLVSVNGSLVNGSFTYLKLTVVFLDVLIFFLVL